MSRGFGVDEPRLLNDSMCLEASHVHTRRQLVGRVSSYLLPFLPSRSLSHISTYLPTNQPTNQPT